MNQTLHIFRKDLRHLWPELVTYAALLLTFAWADPQGWPGVNEPNSLLQILMVLLRALIPILWLVVIARLIQDESLVGDQQFWITRPYTRGSLLGAKLLFVAACVALPFALMQGYLLFHAGLHPLASVPGILLNLLLLTFLCWLPFAAVATVTSTLPRMAMSLVATAIVWIIVLVIIGRTIGARMEPPFFLQVLVTLVTVLLAGTIVYQYMTRNTKYARIVLLAIPALLFALFTVYPTGLLVPYRYAAAKGDTDHFLFNPDPLLQQRQDGKVASFGGHVMVNLPVQMEGLDPKARVSDAGFSVTADAPGYHYQSPWLPGGLGASTAMLLLPQSVAHRLEGTPVHLHLVMVGDQLLPGKAVPVTAASRFDIPGHGTCLLGEDGSEPFCRYPYRNPWPTEVTGPVTLPPCGPGSPTRAGVAQMISFSQPPSLDPVEQQGLEMNGGGAVCPGAQLSFVPYMPSGHVRAELDIPAITLGAYVRRAHPISRGMPPTAPDAPDATAPTPAPVPAPNTAPPSAAKPAR